MQYLLLITPTVCAILAWGQRPGWGWFLFVAAALYPASRILGAAG